MAARQTYDVHHPRHRVAAQLMPALRCSAPWRRRNRSSAIVRAKLAAPPTLPRSQMKLPSLAAPRRTNFSSLRAQRERGALAQLGLTHERKRRRIAAAQVPEPRHPKE